MIDKDFCCSSYLAFRYIVDDDKDFKEGLKHTTSKINPDYNRIAVKNGVELDAALKKIFYSLKTDKKIGIMLSGGMDSACLATYLPKGTSAYTFRFLGGHYQREELMRAEYYAKKCNLNLHYVDINWEDVINLLPEMMKCNACPVHSIVPQIYKATLQAKKDGIEFLIFGESADSTFGGLDRSLSKDWLFNEFVSWFKYLNPNDVLVNPVDVDYVFEKYRIEPDRIDFVSFMREVYGKESETSYCKVSDYTGIEFYYPYQMVCPKGPLDLKRIRSGESKYIIRELFKIKYPDYPIPKKTPMPRPVDDYFKNWNGPVRPEFKKNLDMSKFTGNQKWQMWCLEEFLNMIYPL